MNNKLLIIGASGHGKVLADIAVKMSKWENIAFLDDDEKIESSMGIEVIGQTNQITTFIDEYNIFVGIGNNIVRKRFHSILEKAGATIPILTHPKAIIGEQVEIGVGTAIMAGAIINCCTKIGKGCIINTGSTIDHDNIIGDFVHISPGAHLAGNVNIGSETWLGIGSIVINNINITGKCKIGAGGVVIKDIKNPATYVGVPVRRV